MRMLYRADGTTQELAPDINGGKVAALIGADALDTVSRVHDGCHVMYVDDNGHGKGLPVNEVATRLYHARCYPGSNPPPIVGDVVVLPMGGGY